MTGLRWYDTAAQVPDWPEPATPYDSREWSASWERVTTEPVQAARYAHLTTVGQTCVVPFLLVEGSPAWGAFEAEAKVSDIWGGQPVVFAGSPYATYGGHGASDPAMMEAITAAGLRFAREHRAAALIVPGLRTGYARRWAAASAPRPLTVRTTGSHRAPVRGSLAGFEASIPSSRVRREFGRYWRRADEEGLHLSVLTGTHVAPILADFTKLASASADRHDTALYGADVLAAVSSFPGAALLVAMHGTHLAGGMLCISHRDTLYAWAAGLDYEALPKLHTYRWLFAEVIRHAAATGAVTLDAGRGNYTYKRRLGFELIPLNALCYLVRPAPDLVAALKTMSARMAAGQDWQ